MKYIVYCTTCLDNGIIYIGVHKTENPDIFDGYIGCGLYIGNQIKNPKTAFQHAVKKHGFNKFKRSILYVFDNENDAYKKEEEIVNIDFIKRRDNYNTSLGGYNPCTHYKKIYQYDLNGIFIKEWNSIGDAVKYYKCNSNRFNMAINDCRSAFNSYWSANLYDKLDISNYRKSYHSEIYCYNVDGQLISVFNSVKEISNKFNLSIASINDACSHKKTVKGMYFISDGSNIMDIIKARNFIYNLRDTSVSKYINGKLFQTYPSLKQAAKENNLSTHDIKKDILNNKGNWAFGYSDIYISTQNPKPVKIAQYDLDGNEVKIWESLSQCSKVHPKVRDVLSGTRRHTHGYTFKILQ